MHRCGDEAERQGKVMYVKNLSICGEIFHVEPRGIEPLCPIVESGFLAMRWPQWPHEKYYSRYTK
jgi:hypothetical protein